MYRMGQLLDLRGEKISEDMFYRALLSAMQRVCPDIQLLDYTTAEVPPSCQNGRLITYDTNVHLDCNLMPILLESIKFNVDL